MVMLNATTGFVWGYVQGHLFLWKTTDGGQHWQRYPVDAAPLRDPGVNTPVVDFQSRQVGWIAWVDNGNHASTLHVLRTDDGGRDWTQSTQRMPPVVFQLEQMDFLNQRDGWIRAMSWVGSMSGDPSILQTTNGGQSWHLVSAATGYVPNPQATPDALPAIAEAMPIIFTSPQQGWVAVGSYGPNDPQPTVYETITGGKRWLPHHLPVPPAFRKKNFSSQAYSPVFSGPDGTVLIQFVGSTTAKDNTVVAERTTDGGHTWRAEPPLAAPSQSWGDVVPSFINPNEGWVIGTNGAPFAQTTNGGQSWSRIPLTQSLKALLAYRYPNRQLNIVEHYRIKQLAMVTPKVGWMMLQRGRPGSLNGGTITKFFKTTDGGRTWTAQRNPIEVTAAVDSERWSAAQKR